MRGATGVFVTSLGSRLVPMLDTKNVFDLGSGHNRAGVLA
jgi:hypothetical protein